MLILPTWSTLSGTLNAKIVLVVSNKSSAGILERAAKYGIKNTFIGAKDKTREAYDAEVSRALDDEGVELVLLIGYMRIVSKQFTDHWADR
jgi:folate-dependent phosphoribosylglycinamide formyltransferase PurN